jgi:hypothetical protein
MVDRSSISLATRGADLTGPGEYLHLGLGEVIRDRMLLYVRPGSD